MQFPSSSLRARAIMDLYIASKSDRADIAKVGRSNDANARCATLQASQPFRVTPSAIFPGMGHCEAEVHRALREYRVEDGPSREWFACPLPEAVRLVADVLYPIDRDLPRPEVRDLPSVELVKEWVEGNSVPTTYHEASWRRT